MRHWAVWTDADDAAIRAAFPATDTEIGRRINRSADAVRKRRNTLGLKRREARGKLPIDGDNWQEKATEASRRLAARLQAYSGVAG